MVQQIPRDFPHCGGKRVSMRVCGYAEGPGLDGSILVQCALCAGAQVIFVHTPSGLSLDGLGRISLEEFTTNVFVLRSAPEPPKPRFIDALPPNVEAAFTEGEQTFASRHFASAAVSYRRALERALKNIRPNATGLLAKRIRDLAAENSVPKALIDLMDGIRFLGNEGAHDDEDPPEVEVDAGRDFTTLLLTYLFEMPARVATAKAHREARRSGDTA